MLKGAVTVSKKATFSCHSLRCFLTLITTSLGLEEKGNKKQTKKTVCQTTDKPRLLPSSHSTTEEGEGECVYSVSSWQPYHLCR